MLVCLFVMKRNPRVPDIIHQVVSVSHRHFSYYSILTRRAMPVTVSTWAAVLPSRNRLEHSIHVSPTKAADLVPLQSRTVPYRHRSRMRNPDGMDLIGRLFFLLFPACEPVLPFIRWPDLLLQAPVIPLSRMRSQVSETAEETRCIPSVCECCFGACGWPEGHMQFTISSGSAHQALRLG